MSSSLTSIGKVFMYFFENKYPWIMAWKYDKSYDDLGFPLLTRQVHIKWWKEFL